MSFLRTFFEKLHLYEKIIYCIMSTEQVKSKTGLNFKKIIKNLSNNALKYLINIAHQEASYRNLKINLPDLGKDIPSITISKSQVIKIRDINWIIDSYTIKDHEWVSLSSTLTLDLEALNWFELYKEKQPVSIKLISAENSTEEKIIEFHSRSKIFWFYTVLEESIYDNSIK